MYVVHLLTKRSRQFPENPPSSAFPKASPSREVVVRCSGERSAEHGCLNAPLKQRVVSQSRMPRHKPPGEDCNRAVAFLLAAPKPLQQLIVGPLMHTPWPRPIVAQSAF